MTPDMVLPIFLGVCLAGALIWNIVLTGQNTKLKAEIDDQDAQIETLLDNITFLTVHAPRRDGKGRFKKAA